MASSNGATDGQTQPQAQLNLQRIYIKDVSFEAPGAPQIFQEQGQPNDQRLEQGCCQGRQQAVDPYHADPVMGLQV